MSNSDTAENKFADLDFGPVVGWIITIDLLLLYIVRWPWALIWIRRDDMHNYHELSGRGKEWFILLCSFAVVVQTSFLLEMIALPLMGETINWILVSVWTGLFTTLTIIRFCIWFNFVLSKIAD